MSPLLLLGFALLATAGRAALCSCSNRHVHLTGSDLSWSIFSPDFPRPYCGGLDCLWIVDGPSNASLVRFFAPKVDLRARRDALLLYTADDFSKGLHLASPRAHNASHQCVRRESCEFESDGRLVVRLVTGRGVPDNYGFQATLSLVSYASGPLSGTTDEPDVLHSVWNLLVWVILVFCAVTFVSAVVYLTCVKNNNEENRAPLLEKGKHEESLHLSLNSDLDA